MKVGSDRVPLKRDENDSDEAIVGSGCVPSGSRAARAAKRQAKR